MCCFGDCTSRYSWVILSNIHCAHITVLPFLSLSHSVKMPCYVNGQETLHKYEEREAKTERDRKRESQTERENNLLTAQSLWVTWCEKRTWIVPQSLQPGGFHLVCFSHMHTQMWLYSTVNKSSAVTATVWWDRACAMHILDTFSQAYCH